MLEETLIRENATKKIQKRNVPNSHGPPVTLVSEKKSTPTAAGEADPSLFDMNVVSPTNIPSSPSEDGSSDNAKNNRTSTRLQMDAFVPRE
jgi:hypothetical protein